MRRISRRDFLKGAAAEVQSAPQVTGDGKYVTRALGHESWVYVATTLFDGKIAAGDVCGSVEEKDLKQYGMGFDAALSYGYIMAETVKAEI